MPATLNTEFASLDDLASAVGTRIGTSEWTLIDQKRIDAFAEITGDHQWIHVDRERAAEGPFGNTIAHGYLTLSIVSQFLAETLRISAPVTMINYGLNRTRFPSPVPVGSRIRGHVEIVDLAANARGHQLTSRVTVELEHADKPACVTECVTLLVPEPPAA